VKCYSYFDSFVIFVNNVQSKDSRHKSYNALLAVDKDMLAGRCGSIFQFNIWITPCDQVPDWITLV
jgi:hypothetical protein